MHRSTYRVLQVFDLLASRPEGMSLSELSAAMDVPKGSLHPILKTMVEMNYLCCTQSLVYSIGPNVFYAGSAYVRSSDLLQEIDAVLKRLSAELNQVVYFAVLSSGDCFYLLHETTRTNISVTAKSGHKLPAYATGIGKALLSDKTENEIRAIYPHGLLKVTEHTISDFDVLCAQLEKTRESGFAYESEESTKDVCCIATPVRYGGNILAAISVAVPIFYYNDELASNIEEHLSAARSKVEQVIGLNPGEWIYS